MLYDNDSKIGTQDPEKAGRKTGPRHQVISPNCATKRTVLKESCLLTFLVALEKIEK